MLKNNLIKNLVYPVLISTLINIQTYAQNTTTLNKAYKTFEVLLQIPKNQNDPRRAAREYIFNLADNIGNRDNYVSPKEIKKALKALSNVSGKIADKYFGNKNGLAEVNEINKMNSSIRDYPGLEEIIIMNQEYSQ